MTEAKPKDYWISPTALRITLNALSDADYIQATAASGAMVLCYMKGIDGLGYDNGHNYKRWPLKISQTYFTTTSKKYVYIRIPRAGNNETDTAMVVFPSQHLDLYGMTEGGQQVGDAGYYYIFTQGIISASEPTSNGLRRHWEQNINTGTLDSDEALDSGGTGEWWEYNPITDMVTFLKKIAHGEFEELLADYLEAEQTVTDLVVSRNFLSGPDGEGFRMIRNAGNDVSELEVDRATIREKMYANWLQSSDYTGEGMLDSGFRLWYENGRSKLVIDDIVARGKFSVYNLETRIMTHAGGDVCFSGAGSKLFYVEYLNDAGESLGYTTINSPWMLRDKFLLAGASGLAAWANRRKIQRQLTQEEKASVTKFRCYVFSDDGTMKTRNWWHVHDLARCQTFDQTQLKETSEGYYSGDNVSNTVYWRRVAGIGSKPIEALGDNKIYDYFDLWNVADVSNRTFIDEQGQEQAIGFDIPAEQYTTPGYLQTSQEFPYGDWPAAGDDVVQYGNARDVDRMAVNVLQVTGGEPGLKVYHGIHTYRTDKCKWVDIGYDATIQRANAQIFGDCYIGERYTNDPSDGGSYVWFTTKDANGQPRLRIKARISAQSTYGDSDNVTLEDIFSGINNQLDGKIETWRQPGDPATSWTTDTVRAKHVGDLWMDTSQNGGKKTYIYTDNGAGANPRYSWEPQDVPQEVFDDIDGKAAVYDTWNAWVVDNVSQLHLRDLLVPAADITQGGVTYKRGKVYRCTSLNPITFAEIEYTDDSAFNGYISQIVSGSGASGDAATAANAARALNNALRGQTDIDGGLMLTTMLVMRKLNAGGTYTTWGGLNGAYTDGSTIAAWFGGDFVDYDTLTDAQKAEGWSRYRWATSLFRMNGSGYVAGGNITWDANGDVTVRSTNLSAQHFYLNDIEIFQLENTGTAAEPHYRIKALYDFYSVGAVSALGAGESSGGQTSLNIYLAQLRDVDTAGVQDGQVLMREGTKWVPRDVGATTALSALTDVNVAGVTNGQALVYNSTSQKWVPGTGGVDMSAVWNALSTSDATKQIDYSHLSGAISISGNTITIGSSTITPITSLMGYATKQWVGEQGFASTSWVSNNFLSLSNGTLILTNTNDASPTNYNSPALVVGGKSSQAHIEMDANEIIAKTDATHPASLWLNDKFGVDSDGNGIQIGNIKLVYDSSHNAIKVVKSDGSAANFYATGGVSAQGAGEVSGGGYLPIGGGTMTGLLRVATGVGIDDASGNGLLVYHPTGWTGVSSSQWGVGATGSQGVIRSSDSALIHYRGGNSYEVIDSKGGQTIDNNLTVASLKIEYGNEINSYYSSGNLCLQHSRDGNTLICKGGGKVGIGSGATSPSYRLHVDGSVGASSFNNTSDIRLKDKKSDVKLTVEQIAEAPSFIFTWKTSDDKREYAGTSAQYWQKVLPQVVSKAEDDIGTLSVDYGVTAFSAAKAMAKEVVAMKKEIKALNKKNKAQSDEIKELKSEIADLKEMLNLILKGHGS